MKHFEYENVEFYMGENAKDNWDLLDKSVEINNNYIWFHLNSFSSPYVIMYSTIEELKIKYTESKIQEFLNYGAKLCKENSKYNRTYYIRHNISSHYICSFYAIL